MYSLNEFPPEPRERSEQTVRDLAFLRRALNRWENEGGHIAPPSNLDLAAYIDPSAIFENQKRNTS
jgi:hypothetical protein